MRILEFLAGILLLIFGLVGALSASTARGYPERWACLLFSLIAVAAGFTIVIEVFL